MAFELLDKIAPVDPLIRPGFRALAHVNPLGPLADLPGKWVGEGFNRRRCSVQRYAAGQIR